ncbi:hypothetical protein [Opitutus terrae]|uniref:Uncharacterized protein n=1 Tax=Opitutus terrae (strain DSM 11246 / JCM 15787 / PB90-1) TaxID=452637 RepID=B1ZYJ4_OPITP|nr:hypothetical protein [Opitutus terrae]ACB77090.1 hypothetical protein Oter_3815 [Opitutus terrae PB90-1]
MNNTSHILSLSGLRSVHNARMRFYGVGRDPVFDSANPRQQRPFPGVGTPAGDRAAPPERLWRTDLLDRLEPPLTRYRE